MEVKPGYKQTEVGVIPEEWDVGQLSTLISYGPRNGYSGRSGKDARGTPTLALTATTSGRMILDEKTVKHLEETLEGDSDILLKAGDVLVQRSNTPELVGTTAIFDGPSGVYAYPDLMMRMRFKVPETSYWFWRYANSSAGRRYFVSVAAGSTGTMPKLSGDKLRTMPLPLPPPPEQRAIAEALSDVDGLLGGLDRLIAKKRDLKQAAMQQLLTGQTRLPGFHGEWDQVKLGSLFSFKNGLNKGKEFFGYGTPIVNYMDVFGNTGILCSKLEGRVSLTKQEIKNFDVRKGDVLFTRTSETPEEIGMASVILDEPDETVFSGFVLRGRPKNDILCDVFKAYCFRAPLVRNQIISKASYTTRALTNGRILSAVTLSVPTKAEQTAIAEVLTEIDAELAALGQRREKTRALKQAMMQELLSARTRLV